MHPVVQYLDSVCPLSDACQEAVADMIKTRTLAKREFLLKAGEVNRHIHFIAHGLLRCYYLKGEVEVTDWLRKETDIVVSIDSYYDQRPGSDFIHAVEDSELYYISKEEEDFLFERFPEFNTLGRLLTRRELRTHHQELRSLKMLTGLERYEYLLKNDPDLVRRVPGAYLASYLDMHPESLSRVRTQFSK
jgi:CRP/FNR family transcriptional regulator, anaerobic regulatory protein